MQTVITARLSDVSGGAVRELHATFELAIDQLQAAGKISGPNAVEARRLGNKVARGAQPLVDLPRGLGYAHGMRRPSPGRATGPRPHGDHIAAASSGLYGVGEPLG